MEQGQGAPSPSPTRPGALYTRRQLDQLRRRCDDQHATIERLATENDMVIRALKQYETENTKRARYHQEREREHAREIDRLQRQGRRELMAEVKSRRLREASIAMLEREISRLSKSLNKKVPGGSQTTFPLITELRIEYETRIEALRSRVAELEHGIAVATPKHGSANPVSTDGGHAAVCIDKDNTAAAAPATTGNEADVKVAAAERVAHEAKKKLASQNNVVQRLQRQLTAIAVERDEARAAANDQEATTKHDRARISQLELEARKRQADLRSARKSLKTVIAELDSLKASSKADAVKLKALDELRAEVIAERRKGVIGAKKMKDKLCQRGAELATAKDEAGHTVKELKAVTTELEALKAMQNSAAKTHSMHVQKLEIELTEVKATAAKAIAEAKSTSRPLEDAKARVKELQHACAGQDELLCATRRELAESRNHVADLQKQTTIVQSTLESEKEQQRRQAEELDEARVKVCALERKLQTAEEECGSLRRKSSAAEELLAKKAAEVLAKSHELKELAAKLAHTQGELSMCRTEIRTITEEFRDKSTAKDAELTKAWTAAGEARKTCQVKEREQDVLTEKVARLWEEITAYRAKVEELERSIDDSESCEKTLKTTARTFEKAHKVPLVEMNEDDEDNADSGTLKVQLMKRTEEVETLKREVATLHGKIASTKMTAMEQTARLETQLATLKRDVTHHTVAQKESLVRASERDAHSAHLVSELNETRTALESERVAHAVTKNQLALLNESTELLQSSLDDEVLKRAAASQINATNMDAIQSSLDAAQEELKSLQCERVLKEQTDADAKTRAMQSPPPSQGTHAAPAPAGGRPKIQTSSSATQNFRTPNAVQIRDEDAKLSPLSVDTYIQVYLFTNDEHAICAATRGSGQDCEEGMLPFSEGQMIAVSNESGPFFVGTAIPPTPGADHGLVPMDFVDKLTQEEAIDRANTLIDSGALSLADVAEALEVADGATCHSIDEVEESGVKLAVALYDFSGGDGCLALGESQVLLIYGDMDDDGFFDGELGRQAGKVPSTYIGFLSEEDLRDEVIRVRVVNVNGDRLGVLPLEKLDFGEDQNLLTDLLHSTR